MATMRAKMEVRSVTTPYDGAEKLELAAVCGKEPFGEGGKSEDNTYAMYTPTATLSITITNPALKGLFKHGQKFYVDFTEAVD